MPPALVKASSVSNWIDPEVPLTMCGKMKSPVTAPPGRAVPTPLWNHYATRDGKWLQLVMLQADRYWHRFCEAIERPDLLAARENSAFLASQQLGFTSST